MVTYQPLMASPSMDADAFTSLDTFLRQFPHYSPQLRENIQPYLKAVILEPADYFLSIGSVCRTLAFVEKGLLRQYYLRADKEITHCFCQEQTLSCSYSSLITQQPSDIAIQAIEPTQLWVFSYETLQALYGQNPFWQQVGRLASEQEYLSNERHHRFLQDLSATERYLAFLKQDRQLFQRIPLNYLASYLQIAPETLSRIRQKLART